MRKTYTRRGRAIRLNARIAASLPASNVSSHGMRAVVAMTPSRQGSAFSPVLQTCVGALGAGYALKRTKGALTCTARAATRNSAGAAWLT